MVDLSGTRGAWEGHLVPGRHGAREGPAGVTLTPLDDVDLAIVIARRGGAAETAARLQARYGLALPAGPCRATGGGMALAGIGPGQWLASRRGGPGLADELAVVLAGCASVSEQSDGRAILRIEGPGARTALVKSVPVDLHPAVFKTGDVAVTVMALVGAILWRADETTYAIAVPRSMAGDIAHGLMLDAGEFGVVVGEEARRTSILKGIEAF